MMVERVSMTIHAVRGNQHRQMRKTWNVCAMLCKGDDKSIQEISTVVLMSTGRIHSIIHIHLKFLFCMTMHLHIGHWWSKSTSPSTL
jgi:hypothetical protein